MATNVHRLTGGLRPLVSRRRRSRQRLVATALADSLDGRSEAALGRRRLDLISGEVDVPALTSFDRVELTASQRGNWVARRLVPESSVFCAGQLIWLDGPVDPVVFASSVSVVFSETDAMRVRFGDDDGVPFQYVDTAKTLQTKVVDAGHDDDRIRVMAREQLTATPAATEEPSTYSTLVRRGDGTWAWILVTNVLLVDGYSISLFIRRVAEVYSATRAGGLVPDRWFGSLKDVVDAIGHDVPRAEQDVAYWSSVLGAENPGHGTVEDLSEAFVSSCQPVVVPIPDHTYTRIQQLARTARVSWTDLLITAWGLYTALVDGRDHIAVRVPLMMRDSRELLRTPSAISRPTPVITTISPHHTFTGLLATVADQLKTSRRHTTIEDHQIARLWPDGQASYLTLPTINIRLFEPMRRLADVVVVPETISTGPVGSLDLAVYSNPESGIRLEVSAGSTTTGHPLLHAERFGRFLDAVIAGPPTQTLYGLSTELTPDTDSPHSPQTRGETLDVAPATVDTLLRRRVTASPDVVAVIGDDGTELTYRQFDTRVNALAQLLTDQGVQVGDRVAVAMPRSVDLVAALTGVIRAGAAYVPIDPDYPTERIKHILEDTAPAMVITDHHTGNAHSHALGGQPTPVLRIDDHDVQQHLTAGAETPPVLARPLNDLDAAVVIFTSGTTGRPKGVTIPHRALVNRLTWGERLLEYTPDSVALSKSGVGFVDAVTELFGPMTAGTRTVVLPAQTAQDPARLLETIARHSVTHLLSVPSLADALLRHDNAHTALATIRHWVSSGETLTRNTANTTRTAAPHTVLHNFYGSTEITGDGTTATITDHQHTPIGAPVANTTVRVLDTWLRPVPAGAAGELYLGGVQLADGYLARPALTADRFIADPFNDHGTRLYRTGDVVRWNLQGQLEYLGRSDDQVKIRGFRIELDEIRAVLEEHPSVSGAAVLALDHPAGGKYLTAYVTTTSPTPVEETVLSDTLREHLARTLPQYMMPATLIRLDRFPVTANGKLDRRALPQPNLAAGTASGRPPQTPTEITLANLFRDVLHLDDNTNLGIDNDFFRLGGHSLLATRLIARTNAQLSSALTLRDVFDHPRIGQLAQIADNTTTPTRTPGPRIGQLPRPAALPASYGQQALWFTEQIAGRPIYRTEIVLQAGVRVSLDALATAVRRIVARHEILRTILVPDEETSSLRQVICEEPADDTEVLKVEYLGTESLNDKIAQVVATPLDFTSEFGLKFRLLRHSDGDVLVAYGHHMVTDADSFGILVHELNKFYIEATTGNYAEAEPLPTQYADFAVWQRHVLGNRSDPESRYRLDLRYWQDMLSDLPTETALPLDQPRDGSEERTIRPATTSLLREEAAKLDELLVEHKATPLQALIAAFSLTLWDEGAGNIVPIGTPASLRDQPELHDLIGYFVNTVVVRTDIDAGAGFAQTLLRSRDRMLEATDHKLVPFEHVVEAVNPPRRVGISPLFQVMAAYVDRRGDLGEAPPLTPYTSTTADGPLGSQPALFDLVSSIERLDSGTFGMQLNAARELFSAETTSRLLRRTARFLALGSRHPDLPVRLLAQIVHADEGRTKTINNVGDIRLFHLPLEDFDISVAPLWRAAIDHVSHALSGGSSTLRLAIRDSGAGELVAETSNPEMLDAVGERLTELVTAYHAGTPMVVAATLAAAGHNDDELTEILDDPFWEDWVDQLADAAATVLPERGDSVASEASSVATGRAASAADESSLGSVVLTAVAKALVGIADGDLLVEFHESDGPFMTRRFPVLLGHDDVIRLSPERAAEYASLAGHPRFSRFFDDLPIPRIRVGVFRSRAELITDPAAGVGAPENGLGIHVFVGGAEPDGCVVRVWVESAHTVDVDTNALAAAVAEAIDGVGIPAPGHERRDAFTLRRADRVALTPIEEESIRARYGHDAQILPLAPLQRGLFYHLLRSRESDDHNTYVSQVTRQIAGDLDPERMTTSIAIAMERYPNLRAAFIPPGDVQVIPSGVEVPVRVIRLDEWSSRGVDLEQFLTAERGEPFDFEIPPLIRFTLLEHDRKTWTLAMSFEHILLDGWSISALLAEILSIYADPGYVERVRPSSFRSYLDWVDDQDPDAAYRAWDDYLADLAGPTLLCPDSVDLGDGQSATGELHLDLNPAEAARVFDTARGANVTVGTLLQTAWGIALSRLTGSNDVVFGNTVSGRPPSLPGADRIIGLLFNTVPMRMSLPPFETNRQLLARVQSEQLLVIDYPQASLTQIQTNVGVSVLFDTLFVVQNMPFGKTAGLETAGLQVVGAKVDDATHYPVTFAVDPEEHDGEAAVHVRLSYRQDAFDAPAAELLLNRYVQVLLSLTHQLDEPVGTLSALLPDETVPRTGIAADLIRDTEPVTVAELLHRQVLRSGSKTALVAGDHLFTFAEFFAEVNRYARLLLEAGVRPEHRVALMLPRDERMVIAMFAVFAVGAAYVPVDNELPDERIGYMLSAAEPTVTLVTHRDVDRLDATAGPVISLDSAATLDRLAQLGTDPVTAAERGGPVSLDNLAYIIFTSGTTGRPKGVAVGYRGLTNMYFNHVEKIFDRVVNNQRGRRLRIAHTTSFSFDASWEQLFWLLNGHEVHVIDEEMRRDPQRLLAHFDEMRIDGFDVTPSYVQLLVEEGLLERDRPAGRSVSSDAPGVVFVSLGGEAVPDRLWQQLRNAPGVGSYNLYGPTEYTINALGADLDDSTTSSVGTPIFNTRAYILDQNLQPTLPRVAGELYLVGDGTARGYWGQPALTAERFVACPWEPAERMYRTGDLARWNDNGMIDYLGRADEQIKIRGYRIEPDEIRDVLQAFPGVARAEVVAFDHPTGPQLAAYYSVTSDGDISEPLRRHLATYLPDYMVPASLMAVESFPLTPTGKLDRRALPPPDPAASGAGTGRVLESDTELALAAIFRDVLDLDEELVLDAGNDFFRLGGHSLAAMRLAAQMNRTFPVNIAMRDVITASTIGELSLVVDKKMQQDADPDVEITAIVTRFTQSLNGRNLFCAHPKFGSSSMYSELSRYLPHGVGLVGIDDPAIVGLDIEFDDLEDLSSTYADVIQRLQPTGPYELLGWSYGAHIMFAVARLLVSRGEHVETLVIVDAMPVTEDELVGSAESMRDEMRVAFGEEAFNELLADGKQLKAVETAGRRCDVMTTAPTWGSLDIETLVIASAATNTARVADRGVEDALGWHSHLTNVSFFVAENEDHQSILEPDSGLPKWGPRLTDLLVKESDTDEE
ncbi:amino acid adenylation domain-containing protein [Phytohabitans sp. ZYX-F-186]|uniref:Amino acid adenylation domain-containing protein n=1 Tax=Phytohabitans maris TaxID=3071409 RepID=A0ABU0ZR90_9ACTN|nr:non-ribosomal peptide synthetase [Phytohabitans sp. ZYX-F-186]MDQ7909541.1 amino acid adenylation domain-containing protein [Phytohabitans sp. ZYX-F-186]